VDPHSVFKTGAWHWLFGPETARHGIAIAILKVFYKVPFLALIRMKIKFGFGSGKK